MLATYGLLIVSVVVLAEVSGKVSRANSLTMVGCWFCAFLFSTLIYSPLKVVLISMALKDVGLLESEAQDEIGCFSRLVRSLCI